jgi:hypothetical protein
MIHGMFVQLFIVGELVFDRTTPRSLRHHIPWFTLVFLAVSSQSDTLVPFQSAAPLLLLFCT